MADRPLPLTTAYSHLFRGARLSADRARVGLPLEPCAVRVAFSDGVEVPAELLAGTGGDLLLSVPSYRTSAGTTLDAALWPIASVDDGDAGLITVRLGPRLA